MTAASSITFGAGTHVCSYVVEAAYDGKKPFLIGTFTVPRAPTFQETEAAAMSEMVHKVRQFFVDHLPDEVQPPVSIKAQLGSISFIADDYEWRRTR